MAASHRLKNSDNGESIVTVQKEYDFARVALAIFAWFSMALVFNWSSKGSLNLVPSPIFFTMIQIFAVMFYVVISSRLQSQTIEPPSPTLMKKMIPLGLLQLATKLFHQLALRYIEVALVHTIKVSAPLFVLLTGRFITGEVPTVKMMLSVIPIIAGVILCMGTELEWNSYGMSYAVVGTLSIALQNAFSKVVLTEKHANGLTLVFYTDLVALMVLIPMWVYYEGYEIAYSLAQQDVFFYVALNSFSSFLQTFVSFYVIVNTTGLTYSILTVLKRAVLILGSIFYYNNEITFWHFVGLLIAFSGVSWYTKIKLDLKKHASGHDLEKGGDNSVEMAFKAFH